MKKSVLIFLFCASARMVTAQTAFIEGTNQKIGDIQQKYLSILMGNSKIMGGSTTGRRYYHALIEKDVDKNPLLVNEAGNQLVFSSLATILNIMDENGWEFIRKDEENFGMGYSTFKLLFKKKITEVAMHDQ